MSLTTGLRLSALVALSATLAACASPPPPRIAPRVRVDGASLSQPTPKPAPHAEALAPAPAPALASPPAPAPAVAALPPVPPVAPAARRSGPAPKPGDIVDHPGTAVRALLGAPDLRRREPPAEVWQYAAADCVLDITFYPSKDDEPARAHYLESRTLAGARLEPAACLSRLGQGADRD